MSNTSTSAPLQQLRQGFLANLMVAASVAAYGSVLGLLANQKGLSWLELLVMNLSVFAGSDQFVMVELWLPPLPMAEITLAVMVINLRYLLIGASLRPLFEGKNLGHKMLHIHLVADENWAITMGRLHKEPITTAFLLGGGLCIQSAWCLGTLLGHRLGAVIGQPERFGLDFAFVAVFTALVCSFWRGRQDLLPWLVSGLTALVCAQLLPGKWYILCGGLCGALTAALLPAKGEEI